MPGIYTMAVLTIGLTVIVCIAALNHLTRSDRRPTWLLLAGLPLSFIVNRFIKTPVITSIVAWTGIPPELGPETPLWFIVLIWLNAPAFEEAIKMFPLILPSSRVFLRDAPQALMAGLALGMSFGLGEAAYLAYGIAQSPAYGQLPWYAFTGFASERSIVTFGHGFLTSLAVLGLQSSGKKPLLGYLAAVGLHILINLGPILLALKLIPAFVASMASYAVIILALVIFQKNLQHARRITDGEPQEIVYFQR